ncbi:hypothetical protein LCGC14_2307180 [marine sediment metagenome]|uniref:Metallo-beta-lactamase domain-containing protein n=1 Tax=marine sediment metagenome TaxID=412755 RepID=A0A0F9FGQ1_9ZZZZ|nr:MBL fold metallo-hydrolase [Desulfobacterales bacterium]
MNIQTFHSSSKGNLYKIDDGKTPLLIDPGVPIMEVKKCLNFKVSEIEGALGSHFHADHSQALPDLIKMGIDCWVSRDTAEALKLTGHRIHIIEPEKYFQIGSWSIWPFPLVHDVPNIGFLLSSGDERLLYATDTHYIAATGFEGLTAIMIEINYSMDILEQNIRSGLVDIAQIKRVLFNHMSLKTAIDFLEANDLSRVEEIFLLHLSSGNSIADLFKKEVMRQTGIPTFIGEV